MDWEYFSLEQQHNCLMKAKLTAYSYDNIGNAIVKDVAYNSSKIQYIKGTENKQLVIMGILNHYCIDMKLVAELYYYCPDCDYTKALFFIINEENWIKEQAVDCTDELFDYIVKNLNDILFTENAINHFFIYFKDFFTKAVMIEINEILQQKEIFIKYAEEYFGTKFKEKLDFVNKLKDS